MAAHITKNRSDRRQQSGQYSQARGKAITAMLGNVFNFMIVRPMHMKSMTRHITPSKKFLGQKRQVRILALSVNYFVELNKCY
jgi:hypothetical protein